MLKNAWNFILPSWALALALGWLGLQGWPAAAQLASLLLAFSAFCAWFFRSPRREIPTDPDVLVAPADGRVLEVLKIRDPYVGAGHEVRIFLNVFNVHVQRSPLTVPALVDGTRYFAGKFLAANAPKASLDNEQHWIRLKAGRGRKELRVVVKQIAGLIARRIVPWVRPADVVEGGALIGLIQFGSQVDLLFGADFEPVAVPGQKVVGGETVLARRRARRGPGR